jgi:hypothetical protein
MENCLIWVFSNPVEDGLRYGYGEVHRGRLLERSEGCLAEYVRCKCVRLINSTRIVRAKLTFIVGNNLARLKPPYSMVVEGHSGSHAAARVARRLVGYGRWLAQ